jgi:hypothetical protein
MVSDTKRSEEVDHRQVDAHLGRGHAHLDEGARQVAGVERLRHHLGVPHRLDADVRAVAVGQGANGVDRIDRRGEPRRMARIIPRFLS